MSQKRKFVGEKNGSSPLQRKTTWNIIGSVAGGIIALTATAILVLLHKVKTYVDPYEAMVAEAGCVQKSVQINEVKLSYVEGPVNGPPLVLLHAQFLDWFSYSRVLPELAKSFHVFDVDYPGHGATVAPADYPMTADQIGADLADFIERQIGEPVYVSGNSSGGLLATWLAANRPKWIKAAVLEDPPLFSAEYPRIKHTIADRAFATSYKAATRDHPKDFLLYWIQGNAPFFRKHVGPAAPLLITEIIRIRRKAKPGRPVDLGVVPNTTVRMMLRGMDEYDPRFGAAFYDGTWNKGFDHAEALTKITCPTLLIQANYSMMSDGTLNGAMSKEDAVRATALLRNGKFLKVDANHVVNLDNPEGFIGIVRDFFRGK